MPSQIWVVLKKDKEIKEKKCISKYPLTELPNPLSAKCLILSSKGNQKPVSSYVFS